VKLWDKLEQESPQERSSHLVIWPEAAIPKLLHIAWDTYTDFDQRARAANAGWITGVPWALHKPDDIVFHNGVIAAGIGSGFYEKQRLVPFGESLPFPTIVRKLGPLFNLSEYGFSPGGPNQAPLTAQGFQISPFICYEVVFPELVRQQAKQADFLLTISNDGWFGRSFGPDQHFQMARARALETGKMMIRVTNNGITALINEKGDSLKQLTTFTREVLSGQAYPTTGSTPFLSLGHSPVLLLSFATILFSLLVRFRYALKLSSKAAQNQHQTSTTAPGETLVDA
jgi:apolipoprotein N-acyltransferase